MKTTQRRKFPFEACSVLLFSALALGSVGSAHAQLTPGTRSQPAAATAPAAPAAPSKFSMGPGQPVQDDFAQLDSNHDGKISAQEARTQPALAKNFKQWDKNHDGTLSRQEFQHHGS